MICSYDYQRLPTSSIACFNIQPFATCNVLYKSIAIFHKCHLPHENRSTSAPWSYFFVPDTESLDRLPVVVGYALRASHASTHTLFNDSVFFALWIRQRFQRSRILHPHHLRPHVLAPPADIARHHRREPPACHYPHTRQTSDRSASHCDPSTASVHASRHSCIWRGT